MKVYKYGPYDTHKLAVRAVEALWPYAKKQKDTDRWIYNGTKIWIDGQNYVVSDYGK